MISSAGGWRSVGLGLGLGLFVSRALSEFVGFPGVWPQPLFLLPLLAGLGILLAGLASRRNLDLNPLALLWLYVLFPRIDPLLAGGTSFAALVALALRNLRGRSIPAQLQDLLLFAAAFLLYLHTLAPTVLPADAGEFQLVAQVLGIAHPPGYPLYTILAKLFTLIPFSEVAARVNLLSAVAAALALVVVARTVRQVSGSSVGAGGAAITLGVSTTFWAQATTANIRMLTVFFAALLLWLAVSYAQEQERRRLTLLAAAVGLGIGHHGSLIWMLPPVLAFLWWKRPVVFSRPRSWLGPAVALGLSALPLLYIPLRGITGAPFGAEAIADLPSAVDHILARSFQGDILYFATPETLPQRLAILVNALEMQFGRPILFLSLVGAGLLLWRDRPLALLIGGSSGLVALVGITYRAPQSVEYMLPAYLGVAIAFGYLIGWARRLAGGGLAAVAPAVLLFPAAMGLLDRYPSYLELSHDRSAREYAESVLAESPPGATVLANWHWATPLWYLQEIEGKRPDIKVVYVFPEGATPIGDSWVRRIVESLDHGPTVVTRYFEAYRDLPYRFLSLRDAWLVSEGPRFAAPAGYQPIEATFGDRIRLLGVRIPQRDASPGTQVQLELAWQALEPPDQDHAVFVHLVDSEGRIVGQRDRTYPLGQVEGGEVVADRFDLPILPTADPGTYQLIAGVYLPQSDGGWIRLTTPAGGETMVLSELVLDPRASPTLTLHPSHIPLLGGVTLIGSDYDRTLSGELRLYLHWKLEPRGPSPIRIELLDNGSVVATDSLSLSRAASPRYQTTSFDVPGDSTLLSLHIGAESGEALSRLGPWRAPLPGALTLPPPEEGDRYVDLGGKMVLSGARAETPSEGGDTIAVDLEFVAQAPLARDYAVSVRLRAPSGEVLAAHDSTTALGAIPTLKWIRGTRIHDPHPLPFPGEEPEDILLLSLVVYDAFTLDPLAVLDERISRLGPTIPLGTLPIRR